VERIYHKNFRQIDDFCDQLLQFIEVARRFEAEGKDVMLTYGFISACASQIRLTAEERRRALAHAQYEQVLTEDLWDGAGRQLLPDSRSCSVGARKTSRNQG
jgi:hypothetical protein